MGRALKPKVFLIGETALNLDGAEKLLKHLGVPGWEPDSTTNSEWLTEFFGRACYRSFETEDVKASEMNPNLTMVRKSSEAYIGNVLTKGDGSIFEHAQTNWFFADVSRVFTHELVRHRAGVAISQESLRFVRLTDLNWYEPEIAEQNPEVAELFRQEFEHSSEVQRRLTDMLEFDTKMSFDTKKKLTSSMRRLAPDGLATNIGWSANFRTLRHVIEMRTDPVAEEEIRLVFGEVARICRERWPLLFQDYQVDVVAGLAWWHTVNKKV